MFQSFYAYLIYLTFITIFLLGSKVILDFVIFRHTYSTAICRKKGLPMVIQGIAAVILFYTNSSILNMDLLFPIPPSPKTYFNKCFFSPLSVGNKIYRPLSFCSEWG